MKQHNIKLFFVDLDGTLLDDRKNGKKSISATNLEALRNAERNGIHVVISTGRIGWKAREWFKESGLKYAVTGNGSQIIDDQMNILKELKIPQDKMSKIIDFCEKYDLSFKIDDTPIAYGVNNLLAENVASELNYEVRKDYKIEPQDTIKWIIWGKGPSILPQYTNMFMKEISGISAVSAERGRTIELTHIEADKGLGNKFIIDHLDIPKEQTAHIGDTMNDFPAIKHVGKFIAMADSASALLEKAEYIGPNHFSHGVAEVLKGNFKKNPYKKTN